MNVLHKNLYLTIGLILLLCGNSNILFAEEKKNAYLLDPAIHAKLAKSHTKMDEGLNAEALKILKALLGSKKLKDYDAAVIYQTMAYAENNVGNFNIALNNFTKALSYNALPPDITHQLHYSVAQLLIYLEKPKEALKYLSKWFAKQEVVTAEAHILAATAYYNVKDYKQLITHVEKALRLSSSPAFSWYQLLLAGYYETKAYDKATALIENIISKYPDRTDYWLHLADIYQRSKQEKKALAIYELAYTKGLLKKDDLVRLVNNYLYLQMPYKAASVLEEGMAIGDIKVNKRMLNLLADSWLLAHELDKAEPVFKEIIKKFNDDKTRLRLGQLYVEAEDWKKTIEVLNVPLQSDDQTIKSRVNLLLGIAQYHSKNINEANDAFIKALSDKSTKEQAAWWLEHLKNKTTETQKS